jgi:hypothetical protein
LRKIKGDKLNLFSPDFQREPESGLAACCEFALAEVAIREVAE